MNFEDEHYVRIYTRDTKTWKRWGWEGQTVFMHVMRKLDKAGVMDDIEEPVEDVALMTGLPEEIVSIGLPRVLKSGALEINGTALVAPKYIEAQTAAKTDRQRQKERRERRRAEARGLTDRDDPVTNRDDPVTNRDESVTDGHEWSRPVTPQSGGSDGASGEADLEDWANSTRVTNRDPRVTNRDELVTDSYESVTRRHGATTSTTQGISDQINAEKEIPPTPLRDPFLDSLTGRSPRDRSDVRELFELWKRTFKFHGDKLGRGHSDPRAQILAEAIDDHGLDVCRLVLSVAPNDGMVSGRDDEKRVKHESVQYIFGNPNTFARLLRDAQESERKAQRSAADLIDELKNRRVQA